MEKEKSFDERIMEIHEGQEGRTYDIYREEIEEEEEEYDALFGGYRLEKTGDNEYILRMKGRRLVWISNKMDELTWTLDEFEDFTKNEYVHCLINEIVNQLNKWGDPKDDEEMEKIEKEFFKSLVEKRTKSDK